MNCESCIDEARERNRSLDDLRIKAKQQAKDEEKPKAICRDEATGLFVIDAQTAVTGNFFIVEIISGLQ